MLKPELKIKAKPDTRQVYVLGIDASITATGMFLAPIPSGSGPALYSKVITPSKDKGHPVSDYVRTMRTIEAIDEFIEGIRIVAAGIEQHNSFKGMAVARRLIGIAKVIQYHLFETEGIEVEELNTSTIKKVFHGMGNATKQQMVEAANRHFDLGLVFKATQDKNKTDEDIADAAGAAYMLRLEIEDDVMSALDLESKNV